MHEFGSVMDQVNDLESRITIFRGRTGKLWYIDYVNSRGIYIFMPIPADRNNGGIIPLESMRTFKTEVCHGEPRIPIGVVQNTVNRLYHKALQDIRQATVDPSNIH